MKAAEQYFPVVLFIMLYKVVLTFESVKEILKCDHSNESFWNWYSVLFWSTVWGGKWIKCLSKSIQRKADEQYFAVMLLVFLIFKNMNSYFLEWALSKENQEDGRSVLILTISSMNSKVKCNLNHILFCFVLVWCCLLCCTCATWFLTF